MSNKKKLTIELNKKIEPLLKEYYGLYQIKDREGFIICFQDFDESSDFYFGIVKESYESGGHYIQFSWKPKSTHNKNAGGLTYKMDGFILEFKQWLENLKFYHQPSILDDPLLAGYEEEFYQEYKIMDEDADIKPFNYNQQLQITAFLTAIIDKTDIELDDQKEEIRLELKEEAQKLLTCVTIESKNGFMKKMGKLVAKARKAGMKASKFVFKEFIKEFIKEGAKKTFNFAITQAGNLPEYINTLGA